MNELPHWLHSVDNGTIGEARTRAILINRFWILERSVDIEGADFLIQRKLWGRNLLDERAPCLGYVQSKFCQNDSTSVKVRSEYVIDANKVPRPEFFLFVHSGAAGSETVFFQSAPDIAENFHRTNDTFAAKLTDLKRLPDARVRSVEQVLSQVERSLQQADFRKNRLFYRYLTSTNENTEAPIDYDFTLPLSNSWGDIVEGFHKLQSRTRQLIYDLKSDIKTLEEAMSITDPIRFAEIFEYGHFYFLEDYFYRNSRFFDEEFYNTLVSHKKRVDLLRSRDMLQPFVLLKGKIEEELARRLPKYRKTAVSYICIDVVIDHSALSVQSVSEYESQEDEIRTRTNDNDRWDFKRLFGVIPKVPTYTVYFNRQSLFSHADTASRYPRYVINELDIVLLEQLFGEDEIYR